MKQAMVIIAALLIVGCSMELPTSPGEADETLSARLSAFSGVRYFGDSPFSGSHFVALEITRPEAYRYPVQVTYGPASLKRSAWFADERVIEMPVRIDCNGGVELLAIDAFRTPGPCCVDPAWSLQIDGAPGTFQPPPYCLGGQ